MQIFGLSIVIFVYLNSWKSKWPLIPMRLERDKLYFKIKSQNSLCFRRTHRQFFPINTKISPTLKSHLNKSTHMFVLIQKHVLWRNAISSNHVYGRRYKMLTFPLKIRLPWCFWLNKHGLTHPQLVADPLNIAPPKHTRHRTLPRHKRQQKQCRLQVQ